MSELPIGKMVFGPAEQQLTAGKSMLADIIRECDEAVAACAKMRQRLEELLEVHDFIDNEEEHQTRATQEALAPDAGKQFLEEHNHLKSEVNQLNKALQLKLDAMPSGLSAGQSMKLENDRDQLLSALNLCVEALDYAMAHEQTYGILGCRFVSKFAAALATAKPLLGEK